MKPLELRELDENSIEEIKGFFFGVFTKEPWNDDWSDEQLHHYISDLIGNKNSLTLGLFENGVMTGLSMGSILHWYSGTEYCINEFCISTENQGKGYGTFFLGEIESFLRKKEIRTIFLQTERSVPAFDFYIKNGFSELMDHVSFYKEF